MLFTRWQERRRLCDAAIVDWSSELLAGCFGVRPGRLRREGKMFTQSAHGLGQTLQYQGTGVKVCLLKLGHIDIDSSSFTTQELKKALSKMKEHLKTDDTLEEKVDNAKDLHSFGGLQLLINALNSTEPLMKEYASFVLGAALSSNCLLEPVRMAAYLEGKLRLTILDADNYLEWKTRLRIALKAQGLHQVVEETPPPEGTTNAEKTARQNWLVKDAKAGAMIAASSS
ncbi:nucleotide exchange factor SIL1-like [Hemicordylus capensis]|uniref:nucleotide exchange factor SIL1-like n=1 Tax=Hemicordylus capensis TaxID=884348 RepID=UPI002304B209|nr:nucleotide exchange factor SIL1-like [Hemicordylus capensis]